MINKNLQLELRNKFNPEDSDLRKMQLRMLSMLKYVDSICKDNNIKYWLSSGTCLGAVRHGGFIPWDDDVDIELEKNDFKKLCHILSNDNKFFLQNNRTDLEYLAPYAKLRDPHSYLKENNTNDLNYRFHGIYIDIFCIEPSSSLFITRISSFIQYRLIFPLARIKNKILRQLLIKSIIPLTHKGIFPLLSNLSKINNKGWYRHTLGSCFNARRYRNDFESVKYVDFENTSLPIPINADQYLKKLYGNYEELPPLENIHPHINKIIFYENDNVSLRDSSGSNQDGSSC